MYLASLAPQPWMDALVDVEELAPFVLGLSRVRRVLAHVSTFCIFDDHEVTDDWYLSRDWARRVLGTPLGRRVIRNALCSYAVFQHWGNDPDAFADGTPGGRLLELIAAWNGTEGPQARQIEACLGMPGADVDDHASLPPGAMRWSWGWEGHAHRLLAIDTRTRRSWPENRLTLACQQDLEAALVPDAGRLTIVLSPPPVMGVQLIELAQRIATWVGHAELADAECWGGSGTEETALERLLDCAPCLCLSGDVHYGFVGTLSRERDGRKDHLVCATSSALHNQALQHGWFLFGRQPERALPQEPEPSTERRLGDDTVHVSILGRPPALPEPGARDLERLLPEASRRRSAIVTGCQVVLISFFDQGTRVRLHYHAREEGAWDEILREATLR